jgi:putative glutamine amidotransferase
MPLVAIPRCGRLLDYEEAIRRAGGTVRVLDRATDRPTTVVGLVDGLVLPGGKDVLPSLYGEPAHPSYAADEPGRDEYELELARLAADRDMPLLAICRGMQVLTVARGGSLVQHIPDFVGSHIDHKPAESTSAIVHSVWVTGGSLLADLLRDSLEDEALPVNSQHHQAPRTLGRGLVVTATAPDGVIEAIEDPGQRFCVGVQWHPESFYRTGEFRPLFEAFIEACRRERINV